MKNENYLRTQEVRKDLHAQFTMLEVFLTGWYACRDKHYSRPEELDAQYLELVGALMGGPQGPGLLQLMIEQSMDHLLSRLRADLPYLKPREVLIFSYSVAGFSNALAGNLLGISTVHAAVLKTRLKHAIQACHSPRKALFLSMLPDNS
ncbi:MAG: hypothetical protein J5669_03725 [Bacteroidales bacterium]|nr:hypothetical protein [Bacteroidales bacterium]